jgi:hypothetical protein
MSEREDDGMFIGWAETSPKPDRRFLLGATAALLAGAAVGGAALGQRNAAPGPGGWDQAAVVDHVGLLVSTPYPALLMYGPDGVRTAMLGSNGKLGIAPRLPTEMVAVGPVPAIVRGSLIARGRRSMIALVDAPDAIRPAAAAPTSLPPTQDLGEAHLVGEILDAKCWFGAMRPGLGNTHKACAALCAHGGLPLAFCEAASCRTALDAPLFLDESGRPHGRAILGLIADPVVAAGRIMRIGDLTQFRVAASAVRRV